MSLFVLFALLPVLLFALLGAGLLKRREKSSKRTLVEGTITAARVLDNDAGSVTQFYPVVDVSYAVDGRSWSAIDLPLARETGTDRTKLDALLSSRFRPGQSVSLEFDPADPGRVRIASHQT